MRNIHKHPEPTSLVTYRAQPNARYDDLPPTVKQDVRDNLLQEQGHVCCYCMSRIKRLSTKVDSNSMKIEHWHCQSEYPKEQLEYRNMLAACHGNEGHSFDAQHCDTRKGNSDLIFNPADPHRDIESQLKYLGDGTIQSTDTAFNGQINDVLNLNLPWLKLNREEVVKAVEQALNTHAGTRTRSQIEGLISKWNSVDSDGSQKPFSTVAIYFLKERLRRA